MTNFNEWLEQDKALQELIFEIEALGNSPLEQAQIAFDRLCILYDLPKMPEDLAKYNSYYTKNNIVCPRSVYEELAFLKFLEPGDDPRGLVLAAVFFIKNNIGINIDDVLIKKFGSIENNQRIGIKGEGINTTIEEINDSENWKELGYKIMLKKI